MNRSDFSWSRCLTAIRRAATVAAASVVLAGCAAEPPKVLHQGDATFKRNLETYSVKYHPVGITTNTKTIFEAAIHDAMSAKGYKRVDGANADMIINFKALTKSEKNKPRTAADAAMQDNVGQQRQNVAKVVIVTIEQASTDDIMWIGWSTGAYEDNDVLPKIREAVKGILELIPTRDANAVAAPPAES
ncbi:MAG: DUF4136 domain-containing protein [Myxococcota bacterium]